MKTYARTMKPSTKPDTSRLICHHRPHIISCGGSIPQQPYGSIMPMCAGSCRPCSSRPVVSEYAPAGTGRAPLLQRSEAGKHVRYPHNDQRGRHSGRYHAGQGPDQEARAAGSRTGRAAGTTGNSVYTRPEGAETIHVSRTPGGAYQGARRHTGPYERASPGGGYTMVGRHARGGGHGPATIWCTAGPGSYGAPGHRPYGGCGRHVARGSTMVVRGWARHATIDWSVVVAPPTRCGRP